MRTRTLTIDDDTQPRYVPENVYLAPTEQMVEENICAIVGEHLDTGEETVYLGGYPMMILVCYACGQERI